MVNSRVIGTYVLHIGQFMVNISARLKYGCILYAKISERKISDLSDLTPDVRSYPVLRYLQKVISRKTWKKLLFSWRLEG